MQGDDVSGAAIGQATIGEPVKNPVHSGGYASFPERVELVCGSSRNAGRRERFEARHPGVKSYADWKEMLDTEELDMVSVCTYTVDPDGHDLHTEITLYCIQKGIRAVWCEKPAVASMSGAEAMLAAAEANGTLLVINHNRRWQNVQRRLQARPHHHPHAPHPGPSCSAPPSGQPWSASLGAGCCAGVQAAVADGVLGDITSAEIVWPSGRMGVVGTHVSSPSQRPLCALTGSPIGRNGQSDSRGAVGAVSRVRGRGRVLAPCGSARWAC